VTKTVCQTAVATSAAIGGEYKFQCKEVIGNKLYKFDAGFFSSGKAAGSVDTGGINGTWQRDMMEKRQAKCKGYFQALTKIVSRGNPSATSTTRTPG
jgi:hypothetical protein